MKKLILLLCLGVLVASVFAKDAPSVHYTKTFVDADTLIWTDTAFGGWVKIQGARSMQFYIILEPDVRAGIDTNFASDSFFINVQMSFDRVNIVKTLQLDTLLDDASTWTGLDAIIVDSIQGDFMRAMLIHRDTANILTSGAIVGKTYAKQLRLFYTLVK